MIELRAVCVERRQKSIVIIYDKFMNIDCIETN